MNRNSAVSGHLDGVTGYRHPDYARSLAEFGTPRLLPRSGGSVLERAIPGTSDRDATGCYPMFSCSDWAGLRADLDEWAPDLVCVSMVADPFGRYAPEELKDCFGSRVFPFKEHFVADLRQSPGRFVSKHHRYYARRALGSMTVERCARPADFADEWFGLYANVVERHRLAGLRAFSLAAFEAQLEVPGMVMLRALHDGKAVGAHLWYIQGDVAHSHLAASSPRGYELMAHYALYWSACEMLAGEVDWLNFGGAAGLDPAATDGLTRFKRGWSTGTRTAYFCGRIFNDEKYARALAQRGLSDNGYFPAYRKDEPF